MSLESSIFKRQTSNLNSLELTGALFGIIGVYLTVKENIWCFPVGIINVVITAFLVIELKLYADFLQQVVYFILLILGWYKWTHKEKITSVSKHISRLTLNESVSNLIVWIAGSIVMYYILENYTDAQFPFWDSAGTVLCFIAQWFVANKKIENWILWMIANVIYVVIYYLKGMPFYSVLTAVYFVLAINGFINWKRKLAQK